MIAQTQKLLVGLNASNGALLWQLPFTTDFDQNAFTPIVFQDLLINAGLDQPLTAIRPKLDGGKWIAETVWTNPQTPMFMSSPVLIGGTIYGLTAAEPWPVRRDRRGQRQDALEHTGSRG